MSAVATHPSPASRGSFAGIPREVVAPGFASLLTDVPSAVLAPCCSDPPGKGLRTPPRDALVALGAAVLFTVPLPARTERRRA